MGIDANVVRLVWAAKQQGALLRRTATLGRQELCLSPRSLRHVLKSIGLEPSEAHLTELFAQANGYAEPLLRWLGAEEVESLDASPFEGATLVHDLNEPLPAELKAAFDLVLDGGSLEHVFNFPVAIRNCMEMLVVGGHFLGITPTNSYCGHGFYQFSPELFFRIFSQENGFEIKKLVVFRRAGGPWYRVADPAEVGCRVTLECRQPTLLAVCAQKVAEAPLFTRWPQQSDYARHWSHYAGSDAPRPPKSRPRPLWRKTARRLKKALAPAFRTKFYERDHF